MGCSFCGVHRNLGNKLKKEVKNDVQIFYGEKHGFFGRIFTHAHPPACLQSQLTRVTFGRGLNVSWILSLRGQSSPPEYHHWLNQSP